MLEINFLPESDLTDLTTAADEYALIWNQNREKIIASFLKYTPLKFQEKTINALIFDFKKPSQSHPLLLKAVSSYDEKCADLIHELSHRLIYKRRILLDNEDFKDSTLLHFHMNLFLFDVWKEVFGPEFAMLAKEREKNWSVPKYKTAWEQYEKLSKEDASALITRLYGNRELK